MSTPAFSPFGLPPEAVSSLLNEIGDGGVRLADGGRPALGNAQARDTIRSMRRAAEFLGLDDPYFRLHDGIASATTDIGGRRLTNFTSYDYLGLNGDPRILAAADQAMRRFGTSASASRIVSGERAVHRALETALADLYRAQDCVTMVSGHATNVTVIGHLLERGDAIIHDQLAHNSIVQGALLSGAERISIAHNDTDALAAALARVSGRASRVLVAVEGHYSMDGDIPDLAAVLRLTREHRAWLMVDEAHALGVLGGRGHGLAEECGIDPAEVDIWMGTLSKTLAGCGGYIAGSREIVDYLRCTAPGFVYSVAMPPPMAGAALAALEIMNREPERVSRLRANGAAFRAACRAHGLDTGASIGAAIVPVMIGSSIRAVRAAQFLFAAGINVQPIVYPAVPERAARLRFFLTADHTPDQLADAAGKTAGALAAAASETLDYAALARALA